MAMAEYAPWILIKQGGDGMNSTEHKEWLFEDLENEPENSGAPGSIAYTADLSSILIKDYYGNWNAIVRESRGDK